MAHDIQIKLLPKEAPNIEGYDIAGLSIAAVEVGGDYYDFISIDSDRLAVCLGDVSGKGMPAALLMANLQATLRGQTVSGATPSDCLGRSNELLYGSTDAEKYATLFLGVLEPESGRFCYSNAGHNHPMLFGDRGSPQLLGTGGIPLGMLPQMAYEEGVVTIEPGQLLLIYSDGASEAMNDDEEEYGEERLVGFAAGHRSMSSQALLEAIVEDVQAHAGEAPQMDDITLVAVRREV